MLPINLICACHRASGEWEGNEDYRECIRCRFPWPGARGGLLTCVVCGGAPEVVLLPPNEPPIICHICHGHIPQNAIVRHFDTLISLSDHLSIQRCNVKKSEILCEKHEMEYRFCNGEFMLLCSSCGFRTIVTNEDELKTHFNEIRICCNVSRAMYSAFEYKEHVLIQCKKCLLVEVVKMTPFIRQWLSSGRFGQPFCERKVVLLTDLHIGDHLVFVRSYYEHHVIIVFVNVANGTFKQVGYTTPKIKDAQDERYEMYGKVLMLETTFKMVVDPLVVVDYLPLDTYSTGQILSRAFSAMDQENYNVISNNCEHLTTWCKYGVRECVQLRKMIDKYVDLISSHVDPVVSKVREKIDTVIRDDPNLTQIQTQVLSTSQAIKDSFNNSLNQMFPKNKASEKEIPRTSKPENQ